MLYILYKSFMLAPSAFNIPICFDDFLIEFDMNEYNNKATTTNSNIATTLTTTAYVSKIEANIVNVSIKSLLIVKPLSYNVSTIFE